LKGACRGLHWSGQTRKAQPPIRRIPAASFPCLSSKLDLHARSDVSRTATFSHTTLLFVPSVIPRTRRPHHFKDLFTSYPSRNYRSILRGPTIRHEHESRHAFGSRTWLSCSGWKVFFFDMMQVCLFEGREHHTCKRAAPISVRHIHAGTCPGLCALCREQPARLLVMGST
jgi:hypothetical protein